MVGDRNTPSLSSTYHEIIKGVKLDPLRQRNERVIPLVFSDVRCVKIARDAVLGKKFNDRLGQCIGETGLGEFPSTEVSARLITLDELCKVIFITPRFAFSMELTDLSLSASKRFSAKTTKTIRPLRASKNLLKT